MSLYFAKISIESELPFSFTQKPSISDFNLQSIVV